MDNEAKGELDRYADALSASPDSKGVVVGFAASGEPSNYAAQRAVNTKDYVTKEKGVDSARIEPRTGSGDDKRVDLWIVPTRGHLLRGGNGYGRRGYGETDSAQCQARKAPRQTAQNGATRVSLGARRARPPSGRARICSLLFTGPGLLCSSWSVRSGEFPERCSRSQPAGLFWVWLAAIAVARAQDLA